MSVAAATPRNRVSQLLTAPAATLPPLPSTPAARQAALADAVFAAVLALQAQLTHPDAGVVRAAATTILDFEKTRLRHDRPVVGTASCALLAPRAGSESPLAERAEHGLEPLGELEPLEGGRLSPRVGAEHPLSERAGHPTDLPKAFVEQVRVELQKDADEEGQGEVISWEQAAECARYVHAKMQQQAAADGGPPLTGSVR